MSEISVFAGALFLFVFLGLMFISLGSATIAQINPECAANLRDIERELEALSQEPDEISPFQGPDKTFQRTFDVSRNDTSTTGNIITDIMLTGATFASDVILGTVGAITSSVIEFTAPISKPLISAGTQMFKAVQYFGTSLKLVFNPCFSQISMFLNMVFIPLIAIILIISFRMFIGIVGAIRG